MLATAVAAYLVCAAAVVGLLLWQTNRILTDQVLVTLGAEAELLRAEARTGGDPALVRAVEARSLPGSAGLYFLADAAGNTSTARTATLQPIDTIAPSAPTVSELSGATGYSAGFSVNANAAVTVTVDGAPLDAGFILK